MRQGLPVWLRLQWSLSHRQPTRHIWESDNGIRIIGFGDSGVPYGRSRAVLLYLLIRATETGRVVEGSLDTLVDYFGADWSTDNVESHLRRLLECYYQIRTGDHDCDARQCIDFRALELFEMMHYCPGTRTFRIALARPFMEAVRSGPSFAPTVIQQLVRGGHLATVDVYLWHRWRLHRGDTARIDVKGPDSPFRWIKCIQAPHGWPARLSRHHALIARYWPECPYVLVDDGFAVEYAPPPLEPGTLVPMDWPRAENRQ